MATQNGERNDSVDSAADSGPALRRRAEERARVTAGENLGARSPEEAGRLLYELQVHQIELEMQNEELRRVQEELEASRARYFDLYDLAPVGYFTLGEKGIILEANLTAATLLGTPRGALVRRPLTRFILPEDQDIYYQHHKRLLTTNKPQVGEIRMLRQGSAPFWARLEASIARDQDGKAPVCRATISDISERKQAEAVLQEYSEHLEDMVAERTRSLEKARESLVLQERLAMLGQLSGSIAHELRSPLGAIKNAASLLTMILENPNPDVRETLSILDQEIRISEQIINNLLDFARTRQPQKQPVDVNQAVKQALARIDVPEGVSVQQEMADLPPISADPVQLRQILSNLILNAVQAMPGGGRLTLKTYHPQPAWVAIEIADTGVGISSENLERLFEPLFSTKFRGIGLGLALVKMLVDAHGGAIRIESTAGQGSTFTVELPILCGPFLPDEEGVR